MARRTAAAAAAGAEPISSQLKDSFVLRSLHAWSNSPRSSILCNVAEAQDLLGHVLDDREASPLCLHLGQRPTKFVTVLGRVVGCEDREGWTRLWVDDGTAVVSVQHNHSDVISASTEPAAPVEAPAPPPVMEGVPAAYRPRHAPARAPPGSKRSGAPDAAERARTGAAAAERARVDVGQVVRVCGRMKRFPWGVGIVVGKNTWGKGGGGFVEVQRDPNAEAHHILACATLRLTYMRPFVLPSTTEEPTPSAVKQRAAAGPYSRTHRSLRAGNSWYQAKAERAPEAYAEAENRMREGARRRALMLGEKLEDESGSSKVADAYQKPSKVVPEYDEEEETSRREQKARVARAMGYDLVDAPMLSLKGKERQREDVEETSHRRLKSSMKAEPASIKQHSAAHRPSARELAIERELNATSSKPDLIDLTLPSPPSASSKPARSSVAASPSMSRSILPRARSSRRTNDVTPTQLASLQSAVSLSRASLSDPTSSCYGNRQRASVMTSPSADRRLRPHKSLPDSKMSEGLFRLHVHQHIMTHFAAPTASDGSTSWTESEPDDYLVLQPAHQRKPSCPAFTAAALTEDTALSGMAERVVRVLLRRKAVSATFSTPAQATAPSDGAALRARATRLFDWTLKQLVAEGTLEQISLAAESARASASPADKLDVQVGGGVKRRLACIDSSSRKSQRLAVSAYRLVSSSASTTA